MKEIERLFEKTKNNLLTITKEEFLKSFLKGSAIYGDYIELTTYLPEFLDSLEMNGVQWTRSDGYKRLIQNDICYLLNKNDIILGEVIFKDNYIEIFRYNLTGMFKNTDFYINYNNKIIKGNVPPEKIFMKELDTFRYFYMEHNDYNFQIYVDYSASIEVTCTYRNMNLKIHIKDNKCVIGTWYVCNINASDCYRLNINKVNMLFQKYLNDIEFNMLTKENNQRFYTALDLFERYILLFNHIVDDVDEFIEGEY